MIIVNIMKPSWGTLTHWQLSNDTQNMTQAMSSGRCQHVNLLAGTRVSKRDLGLSKDLYLRN
jgi:hypothetical protein